MITTKGMIWRKAHNQNLRQFVIYVNGDNYSKEGFDTNFLKEYFSEIPDFLLIKETNEIQAERVISKKVHAVIQRQPGFITINRTDNAQLDESHAVIHPKGECVTITEEDFLSEVETFGTKKTGYTTYFSPSGSGRCRTFGNRRLEKKFGEYPDCLSVKTEKSITLLSRDKYSKLEKYYIYQGLPRVM